MKNYLCFALVASAVISGGGARADVKLPSIISDHMVLKRAGKVPIWGAADPGEDVKVAINSLSASAKADAGGKWMLFLDLKDSAPGPFEMAVEGKNKLALADVVVGEVWVASGQSNMEWVVSNTRDAEKEIAASANPLLRPFFVQKNAVADPVGDVEGSWAVASPGTTGRFSAVGYYFA